MTEFDVQFVDESREISTVVIKVPLSTTKQRKSVVLEAVLKAFARTEGRTFAEMENLLNPVTEASRDFKYYYVTVNSTVVGDPTYKQRLEDNLLVESIFLD